MEINFNNSIYRLERNTYPNGRTALVLANVSGDRTDVIRATCNIPDVPLEENEVFIKTWSENEGLLEVLESAGAVRVLDPAVIIPDSFGKPARCEIIIDF